MLWSFIQPFCRSCLAVGSSTKVQILLTDEVAITIYAFQNVVNNNSGSGMTENIIMLTLIWGKLCVQPRGGESTLSACPTTSLNQLCKTK